MSTIGNILWFLFGGLIGGLAWVLAGCLWCITIIGIPVGLQCFKFASLAFFPFGKEVVYGGGGFSFLVNLIWIIFFGLEMAIGYCILGCLCVARQFFCETRTEFLRKNSPVLRSKSETRSLASTAPKMEGAAHVKGRVLAWGGAAFAAPPLAFCPCGSSYSSVASPASSAASWAATGSVYSDQP